MNSFYISSIFIGLIVVTYFSLSGHTRPIAEKFIGGLTYTTEKPTLWFVVDDFGTNSRKWGDFGSRNSKDPNVGFLSITKTRCAVTQGDDYNVVELIGRKAVANKIFASGGYVPGQHLAVPNYLWRAWARAALLSQLGGLYLDGYCLCLGPSFKQSIKSEACVFGIDFHERHGSGSKACGPFAGWSAKAGNDAWKTLTSGLAELIDAGPLSWTAAEARKQLEKWHSKYLSAFMPCIADIEWSRNKDGEALEISDILGRSLSPDWNPPSSAIYLPLDIDKLERNVTYKWFLRMSTEQIMDPNSMFIWAELARRAGRNDNFLKKK
jgi:hypothetical protein